MLSKKVVGKRLRDLRGDVPRDIVAEAVGISVSALSMYENGERTPRDEIKVSIANYYKTNIGKLFYGE